MTASFEPHHWLLQELLEAAEGEVVLEIPRQLSITERMRLQNACRVPGVKAEFSPELVLLTLENDEGR